jgi:hypothetical protein
VEQVGDRGVAIFDGGAFVVAESTSDELAAMG